MPIELTEDETSMLAAADRFIEREMKPSIGNLRARAPIPDPDRQGIRRGRLHGRRLRSRLRWRRVGRARRRVVERAAGGNRAGLRRYLSLQQRTDDGARALRLRPDQSSSGLGRCAAAKRSHPSASQSRTAARTWRKSRPAPARTAMTSCWMDPRCFPPMPALLSMA